jgi:hypothetical protein
MASPRLRILCLHGKQQNRETFRTKLGRIPHKLKNLADLTIVDAPFVLEDVQTPMATVSSSVPTTQESANNNSGDASDSSKTESELTDGARINVSPPAPGRSWFERDLETGKISSESLNESLRYLRQIWQELGPFDGVLGFSMGGTMAAMMPLVLASGAVSVSAPALVPVGGEATPLCELREFCPALRFIICAGAVDIPQELEAMVAAGNLPLCSPFLIDSSVASLHIAGMADTAVPIASSIALSKKFLGPSRFIEHEQGHHIPMKAAVLNQIVEFVQSQRL